MPGVDVIAMLAKPIDDVSIERHPVTRAPRRGYMMGSSREYDHPCLGLIVPDETGEKFLGLADRASLVIIAL